MPSATSSSAIITEPGQSGIVPTVSTLESLKEDTSVLEAPTVTELTKGTVDSPDIEIPSTGNMQPDIHILIPENKVEAPKEEVIVKTGPEVKAEPITHSNTSHSDSTPLVEDQILFNASVATVQLDYEKMTQVILICANVFLLGVILFLSLR
jgi:hypothetical protein